MTEVDNSPHKNVKVDDILQGCTTWVTKFVQWHPKCVSSERNMLRVTYLATRILRWLFYFEKMCAFLTHCI